MTSFFFKKKSEQTKPLGAADVSFAHRIHLWKAFTLMTSVAYLRLCPIAFSWLRNFLSQSCSTLPALNTDPFLCYPIWDLPWKTLIATSLRSLVHGFFDSSCFCDESTLAWSSPLLPFHGWWRATMCQCHSLFALYQVIATLLCPMWGSQASGNTYIVA